MTPNNSSVSLEDDTNCNDFIGMLADGSALRSANGLLLLNSLRDHLRLCEYFQLKPIPNNLTRNTFWQYGCGNHATAYITFLESTMIKA